MPKWKKLIDLLTDSTASDAERDDAAIDLSNYTNNEVILALLYTARDNDVDEMVKASCGESLAIIFITIDTFRTEIYELLDGTSKIEFINYIKHNKKD